MSRRRTIQKWSIAALLLFGVLLSSCAIRDLNQDLEVARADYGYFKGQIVGPEEGPKVLLVLTHDVDGVTVFESTRTTRYGETVYSLVSRSDYSLVAFEDTNGDFMYQRGEAAAHIEGPTINWFSDMPKDRLVDYEGLRVQQVELSPDTILEGEFDLSVHTLKSKRVSSQNFLRVVTWDDDNFSDESVAIGMWQPRVYLENIGFGLYLLDEFDPAKKSVLLVHGINSSPRVMQTLAGSIPDEYQVLIYQYPGSFTLEYSSYALSELLGELIQRYDIPEIDVVAHSMGGLVGKGMIYQAEPDVRERLRIFISISTPFGGNAAAASGTKWSPVVAPVWWSMSPDSHYLQTIGSLDLSQGPTHHLVYTFAHEAGGERKDDDGVVSVETQLVESATNDATAIYGIADTHTGVIVNECALRLVPEILKDGSAKVPMDDC